MELRNSALGESFLRKRGLVARHLARDLLLRRVGDRIGRIQDYADACTTGFGTVQEALKDLAAVGAVALEARGHRGTYVIAIDYQRLWEVSGLGSMLGLMPLPYSRRYEGLATGLYECFRTHGIPFRLGYMRGAGDRLAALRQGQCSFVIMSRLSADLSAQSDRVEPLVGFGPRTYVGRHAILLAPGLSGGIVDGMRVGTDPNSLDQNWLTAKECDGKRVRLVETAYTQLLTMLREGRIDAAIWNIDEVPEALGLTIEPLTAPAARMLSARNTEAVLVISADRPELAAILKQVVEPSVVVDVQASVLDGSRMPSY